MRALTLGFLLALLMMTSAVAEAALPPYCSDGCKSFRPCSKECRTATDEVITCGEWGLCESGDDGGGGGGGSSGSSCAEMGWFEANQQSACDASCAASCVKKQSCGGQPCEPFPNYCWKCAAGPGSGGGGGGDPAGDFHLFVDYVYTEGGDLQSSAIGEYTGTAPKTVKLKGTMRPVGGPSSASVSVTSPICVVRVEDFIGKRADENEWEIVWDLIECYPDDRRLTRARLVRVGYSKTCWQNPMPLGSACAYWQMSAGCTATCVPTPPVLHWGFCIPQVGYVVPFVSVEGVIGCFEYGGHTHDFVCFCGDFSARVPPFISTEGGEGASGAAAFASTPEQCAEMCAQEDPW